MKRKTIGDYEKERWNVGETLKSISSYVDSSIKFGSAVKALPKEPSAAEVNILLAAARGLYVKGEDVVCGLTNYLTLKEDLDQERKIFTAQMLEFTNLRQKQTKEFILELESLHAAVKAGEKINAFERLRNAAYQFNKLEKEANKILKEQKS